MEKGSAKAVATQGVAPATKSASTIETKKLVKKAPAQTEVDAKNKENVKAAVKKEKDLMYNYISDMTGEEKKKFRTQARRTRANYEKNILAAKGEEKGKLLNEAMAWAKETYSPSYFQTVSF